VLEDSERKLHEIEYCRAGRHGVMNGGGRCHNGNRSVGDAAYRFARTVMCVIEGEQISQGEHLGGEKTIESAEAEGAAAAKEIGDMRGLESGLAGEESSIHTASIDPPEEFQAETLLQLGEVHCGNTVIRVNYRIGGRSVARMTAPTSSPISSLILTAEHPVTRTSANCENAALVLLATSTWSEGAWKGTYTCWNPHQIADVWPGDQLQVEAPSADMSSELLVRNVQIRATSCAPELMSYTATFANEWAEALSLTMNEGAPLSAWLPPVALTSSTALVSARDLSVTSVSTTQIQVQVGLTPPTGGGFEVRRSDWKFGAGDGADLVLRSPVANLTIVREAPVERYYVRMYDGATPPNYSRFSSAIFVSAATQ
jgi:hypothetical protein